MQNKQFIIAVGYDYDGEIYNNMIIVDIVDDKKQALKIADQYQKQNDVDIVNVYESTKIY